MAFPAAGRIIAPSPASCCPVRKPFVHVRLNEPRGGSIRFTRATRTGDGGLEETNLPCPVHFLRAFVAVLGLLLGDGGSHLRREPLFRLYTLHMKLSKSNHDPSINVLSFGQVKVWMEISRQDNVFPLLSSFYSVITTKCILQFHTVFSEGN